MQVLFEELVGVTDNIGTERLEVFCTEAGERVQGRYEEVEARYLFLAFSHFLLKDDISLRHELIGLIFELSDLS